MVLFIFTLVLMFSLSAVLYLMVRALPRVEEANGSVGGGASGAGAVGLAGGTVNGTAGIGAPRGLLDRWAHSELPEKIDASFNTWLLKFLRKFKVFTLKLDNAISKHLRKINHEQAASEKKATIDFKEISGKNAAGDSNASDDSDES
jgi:hypothetical protein